MFKQICAVHVSVGFGALLLLGGCATTNTTPPVIALAADRNCAEKLDLTAAKALSLDTPAAIPVDMTDSMPCLKEADGSRSTYAAFRLPDATVNYRVDITSLVQGYSLFAPRVFVLSGDEKLVRTIPRDDFMFRGSSLKVSVFVSGVAAAEKYIVIASVPQSVGQTDHHFVSSRSTTSLPYGGSYSWGSEDTKGFTYSYDGRLTVEVIGPSPVARAK